MIFNTQHEWFLCNGCLFLHEWFQKLINYFKIYGVVFIHATCLHLYVTPRWSVQCALTQSRFDSCFGIISLAFDWMVTQPNNWDLESCLDPATNHYQTNYTIGIYIVILTANHGQLAQWPPSYTTGILSEFTCKLHANPQSSNIIYSTSLVNRTWLTKLKLSEQKVEPKKRLKFLVLPWAENFANKFVMFASAFYRQS